MHSGIHLHQQPLEKAAGVSSAITYDSLVSECRLQVETKNLPYCDYQPVCTLPDGLDSECAVARCTYVYGHKQCVIEYKPMDTGTDPTCNRDGSGNEGFCDGAGYCVLCNRRFQCNRMTYDGAPDQNMFCWNPTDDPMQKKCSECRKRDADCPRGLKCVDIGTNLFRCRAP